MRWKMSAGAVMALAFLIPATPAPAQAAPPGLDQACKTVERKVFKDVRKLVTIDLDTATDTDIRVLANQILNAANADSLPVLPRELQKALDGTADDLRAFLQTNLQKAWSADLRISVVRTLPDAGANVEAAAQKALDAATIEAYLTYLNDGLYTARALDCASPSPTPSSSPTTPAPSATPSATTTVEPTPTSSASPVTPGDGEGGGLPVTGADTGAVAGIGGALLLLGGAGFLIGRRRRSRFEA